MKKYVYELYNLLGTIEYVGETVNPKRRLKRHKCKAGKFYKRSDIQMNIVKEFDNRKDAYAYQCILQKQYGLKTDSDLLSEGQIGKTHSEKSKLKIGLASKGNQHNKGKHHSTESKQRMSEAMKLSWAKRKSSPSIT